MAAPTTPATTVELGSVPFQTFLDELKTKFALKYDAVGAAILNNQDPAAIQPLPPAPTAMDMALNELTGRPAFPPRYKYPREPPTPELLLQAAAAGVTLSPFDQPMTTESQNRFTADLRQHEALKKDHKAKVTQANASDRACATDLLAQLGPLTKVQLGNSPQYKQLMATVPSDEVQSNVSYQLITMLYDIFHSGSTADQIANFMTLFNFIPSPDSTASENIQMIERKFAAAFGSIASKDGTVSIDNIKALLTLNILSIVGQTQEHAKRAFLRALTTTDQHDKKTLPPSEVVRALYMEESMMSASIDNNTNKQSEQAAAFKAAVITTPQQKNTATTTNTTNTAAGGGGKYHRAKKHSTPCSWCLAEDPKYPKHGHTSAECSKNPKNDNNQRKVTGHIATISPPASIATTTPDANEFARLKGQNEAFQAMFQLANNSPSDASVMTTNTI